MTNHNVEFIYVTYIRSTAEKVFDAIINPEITPQYWGHKNISDWQVGSTWQHIRSNEEQTVELVGEVIEINQPKKLVITWANASQADDQSQYSRVTFDLETIDEMVKLTVTHDRLIANSGMHTGISKGWPIVLANLKTLLETNQAFDLMRIFTLSKE